MSSTDRDWREWAKIDPYFAVLTHDQFRGGASKPTFFRMGEDEVAKALEIVEAAFGPVRRGRALEFGSGVGRLTMPLARRFEEVVGVDISPEMRAEAARNCEAARILNASFAPSDLSLSAAAGSFDFVLSLITLQHLPAKAGMKVIESLLARLAPGGAVYIDIPIYHTRPSWLRAVAYPVKRALATLRRAGPPMQMNVYPLGRVLERFHAHGIENVTIRCGDHGGPLVASIAGRKPAR